jgi:hypothetical protein
VVAAAHYVARLGEKRGEIIRHVLESGGQAEIRDDLMPRFASPKARPWDFGRRVLGPLFEAGILLREGSAVAIAPDWREALERERQEADEIEDARRQRQKHARQREAYRKRDRTPADEQPNPLRGKEAVARMIAERAREEKQRWIEEQRKKVGMTAAVFLADEIAGEEYGPRFTDAAGRWKTLHGGSVSEIWRAIHFGPFDLRRVSGELYIDPEPVEPPHAEPSDSNEEPPDPEMHRLDCECPDCSCRAPRYARAWSPA